MACRGPISENYWPSCESPQGTAGWIPHTNPFLQKQENGCGLEVGEKFGHHYALAPADFEESALCENSQGTGKRRTQLVSLTSCVPSRMPPVMQWAGQGTPWQNDGKVQFSKRHLSQTLSEIHIPLRAHTDIIEGCRVTHRCRPQETTPFVTLGEMCHFSKKLSFFFPRTKAVIIQVFTTGLA